jgi:fibronectin-binding autotransporter adhesin
MEVRCVPSTIVVNNPTDTPVIGLIDLRQAIVQANTNGGVETITFDKTVFKTPRTITLTGSQLELSDTTETETITGPKVGVTVSGGGLSRVFEVEAGVTASISGMTITGGNTGYYGAGAGLYNTGTTTLTNCTISGNSFSVIGGGMFNGYRSTATLTNCTVSGNSAAAGGGMANEGALTLTNCTVSGNSAAYLNSLTEQEAMDQVFRHVMLYLCSTCYERWIEKPTGSQ